MSRPIPVDPADLRAARLAVGLSQERLALAMGCSRNDVSQWERGKRRIGFRLLCRWADAVGVDFAYDGKAVVFSARA